MGARDMNSLSGFNGENDPACGKSKYSRSGISRIWIQTEKIELNEVFSACFLNWY